MRKILQKHGLPQDLVYLALVESGFDPLAHSPAQALGMWQFLDGTASIYGLMRNTWVDERRDPLKSTEAAAKYLKDLYGIFHDWFLVLAAYNTGQYRVLKAIFEADSRDYWVLNLPSQTEDFVPRFLAATIIAKNPGLYGFHVRFEKPIDHDVVMVDNQADLQTIAACMDCDVALLQELNPELVYSLTPPHEQVYPLRIPKGTKETFSLCLEKTLDNPQLTGPSQDWLMKKSNASVFF
jgi:membrane-bound lytic murein transglycosylase D